MHANLRSLFALVVFLLDAAGLAQANPCNANQEQLRSFLASKNSPLAGLTDDLFHHALTYGVDPRLLIAIAWQETHAGTDALKNPNNIWDDFYSGASSSPFESPEQALADAARTIRDEYFTKRQSRSIRDIGYIYTATQQEAWVSNVSSLYLGWGGDPNDLTYSCADKKIIFFDDAGDPSTSDWSWKQGTWGIAPGTGPATFFSVPYAWGTGYYTGPQNIALFSRNFDLQNVTSATLTFWHRYALGGNDGLWVWVSMDGGNNFYRLYPGFNGSQPRWVKASFNLDAYVGRPSVQVAFQLYSDGGGGQKQGWLIDNVAIVGTGVQANNAAGDLDLQARSDMIRRAAKDSRFFGALFNTFGQDLNWSPPFELRWMAFNVSGGRTAFIYQARSTTTGDRFTTYFDPDTNQQTPWEKAQ